MSLKLQKRLAASVLKCGKNKIWMDPNEINEISLANSRFSIRKLYKEGLILKKPPKVYSRARVRLYKLAKRKGRHMGIGKRRGTKNARTNTKTLWIKRQRVLRRLLKRFRDAKKIDRHLYHSFYLRCKGNQFKNKRTLVEAIQREKAEILKKKTIADQLEAKRLKAQILRNKRKMKKDKEQ
ncbi:60S ribosomal protein L19, putative [Plasmodium vinckei]|uniref:60S ribosomal protein L19, putative n=5 Tax=Plasmodium (Vinckeia) TaxID=418101 RepID=A0A077TRR2_PLACU|nr:60S ribosomal protein L19, putative [Plasmodium chabaudi chabaudi]CAD2098815.1 60S ribosomal protein L19, putative [Plasmodium vinckei lentum]CAD2109921.1 60S ribosomal protein L19, putative [Plasmodium vinckei]CAD2110023.1 60S ribosomal protein L19, putative [Plasmodium vinckei petteri]SCM23209.1 60S ribosomal protein L19, putative [Plasmodium chabaudi adami]SCM25066.1 60S ribosomal protein L19, putative [Plasmodium chabaudi chabaudi]|eukprot:XP_016654296.1 60S ribosomal protein L19, putative [Plasmodium chabaudi chabaudi]